MTDAAAPAPSRCLARRAPIVLALALVALLAVAVASASAAELSGVNLATYKRVGRHDLPAPPAATPPNSLLAQEASSKPRVRQSKPIASGCSAAQRADEAMEQADREVVDRFPAEVLELAQRGGLAGAEHAGDEQDRWRSSGRLSEDSLAMRRCARRAGKSEEGSAQSRARRDQGSVELSSAHSARKRQDRAVRARAGQAGRLVPRSSIGLGASGSGARTGEPEHQRDRRGLGGQGGEADVADLEEPAMFGVQGPQGGRRGFEQHAVVADQRRAAVDQRERQARLAAARRAFDQHRATADRDAARLVRARSLTPPAARARRQAPGLPSARSATVSEPSCASAMVRAMARPRPLWLPNSSLSGRAVWKRAKTFSRSSLGDAGAVVADADDDPLALARARDVDHAVGRRERDRVVEQVLDHPLEPQRHAEHARGAPLAVDLDVAAGVEPAAPRAPRPAFSISFDRSIGSNVARLSSASMRLASAISVTSRSIRCTSCAASWLSCLRSSGPRPGRAIRARCAGSRAGS